MDRNVLNVTVILLDDGYASTALMPIEVFHSAGALWRELNGEEPQPRFRVTTASIGGGPVRSPYAGLHMSPETALESVERTDIAIIPTSGLSFNEKLIENSALLPWLQKQHANGAYLAGVCMVAAYLAEAGLLDGRQATTHWAIANQFRERWANVDWRPDLFVTEDARLLCSGGLTAAADVSLYLVEKLCGHEVAVQTAKALLLTMPRTHQLGYAVLPFSPAHTDERVQAAERFIQTHFREALTSDAIASHVAMSSRTLIRRFKAATGRLPGAYLQAVRIEAAKAMLESNDAPIQTIASSVGYDDVAHFRELFKRSNGMTPAEYRAHFAELRVRQVEQAAPVKR
ncbi:MAG: helix-turn-helix domain-containing protein [Hyphomonadaceae bacterium]|nr:helix-turn-helix domain-containing protein [Hyphomonadaceae bacterium]